MRKYFFILFLHFLLPAAHAQLTLSGNVLDKSRTTYVEGVRVVSTGGGLAFTDSLGHYSINVVRADSVFFMYDNKPTQKFAVSAVPDIYQFDIALQVPIKGRYKVLSEVLVYSNTYKQDSVENRETYNNVFSYHKPKVETSVAPGGGVGMDVDELINMFRFRHNRMMRDFQKRLEEQEKDKYIDYRFSKATVRRITQLKGAALDTFLVWYRPDYDFTANSSDVAFDQYILNALYQYRRITGEGKKEE